MPKAKQPPSATPKETELSKAIRGAIQAVAETQNGVIFIRYIMTFCCYRKNVLGVGHDGKVDPYLIAYNEGLRDAYIGLRKYIPAKLLDKIETNERLPHEK